MNFPNLEKVLNIYGRELEKRYKEEVPVATHYLQNSAKFFINHNGTIYEVGLNLIDYWKYSEYGRGPGKFPPIDKILNWIKVKPVIPREINGKIPTEKQLAFLIARKIAREGTEGQHTFEKTTDELINEMLDDIKNAFIEDMGNEIDLAITFFSNKKL